jgi:hypothetical protein
MALSRHYQAQFAPRAATARRMAHFLVWTTRPESGRIVNVCIFHQTAETIPVENGPDNAITSPPDIGAGGKGEDAKIGKMQNC